MLRTKNLKQLSEVAAFIVLGLGLLYLTGCSLEGSFEYLNGGPAGGYIQGKALMFENSSNQKGLSNSILSTCSDRKVSIHKIQSDGSIDSSFVAEVTIEPDGSFQIPKANTYAITNNNVINYVLKASGCSEEFYRPVTGVDAQDISMGTTFLGFLPLVSDAGKTNLNSMTLSQANSVISALLNINESNLSDSFDAIAADADKKAAFEAFTGTTMQRLKQIPPTIVTTSLPAVIKEGQNNSLLVTALHWDPKYQMAYQWSVDGVSLSTTNQLSWSLNKNSQGAHTVLLKIGSDNGSGSIDLGKPVYQKSLNFNVENSYPATAPTITASDYVNAVNLPLQINTGAFMVNCETFSSMAIVEGYLPPAAAYFTRTCSTAGTQTETLILSNTETTRQVALWVKDAAGNISVTHSGVFVSLDTTLPSASINDLSGAQGVGSSVSVHWSSADSSGLSVLKLQYASDGTTFSDVVNLLTSSATPYAWTVPADNVSTAKLRISATDLAGNSTTATTTAFTIDATVPGPPTAVLSGAPTLASAAFDVTVTFSESVTGLLASDFTVTNGTASNLVATSGGLYTITVTPSIAAGASGVTTVKLPSGTVVDLSSDPNVADSNTLSITVDKQKPTVSLSSASPDPTNADVTVTVTFSESVTGFTSGDVSVTNGSVSSVAGSGTTYTLVIANSIAAQNTGTLSISIPAGGATDAAGNTNDATSSSLTRAIDKVGPTVSLTSASANPTNTTFAVTATLGKASSNFSVGDITVSGGSAANFASSSSVVYTFNVVPDAQASSPGTVSVSIAAGTLTDSSLGNANPVSNTLTRTVSEISQNWSTALTSSDPAVLPVVAGVASLSSTNLTQTDFTAGTHVGTLYDATAGKLTLSSTLPSPKGLDSGWTPKWNNIVGYWPMNGDWGDHSSLGANGATAVGSAAFAASGKVGQTGAFPGGTDYSSVTDAVPLQLTGNITFGGWFKTSGTNDYSGIMTKSMNASPITGYGLTISNTSKVRCNIVNTHPTTLGVVNSTASVEDGKWHHALCIYDGSYVYIYIDGQLEAKAAYSSGMTTSTEPLRIGSDGGTSSRYFNGSLDELAVWNVSLTAAEVKYIYDRQNPNSAQSELDSSWTPHWGNLVGYYNFNADGSDSSGNSRTLTANNGVAPVSSNMKLGSASASFDGTDDYFSNTSANFRSSGAISASAWIYPTSNAANSIILREGAGVDEQYSLFRKTTGALYTQVYCTDTSVFTTFASPDNLLPLNEWHHVALIRDASLNYSLLIDGKVVGAGQITCPIPISATTFVVGGSPSQRFTGFIDELAIWATTLTNEEVVQIYTKQAFKFGGLYKSPISQVPSTSSFSKSKWMTALPFLKELPGDTNADATPDSESAAEYSGLLANLGTNLEGLWRFNEGSAGTVTGSLDFADSSGKSRHMSKTAAGVTFGQAGILKNALTLDGSSGGSNVAANFDTGALTEVTVSQWVKNNSPTVTATQVIFYRSGPKLELFVSSDGAFRAWINNSGGWHSAAISPIYTDWNQWHHLVATYDGANVKLYRDGMLIKTSSAETGAIPTGAGGVRIGYETNNNYWNGTIDEIAMWSRTLSAGEILQLYRRGANRNKLQFRTCTQSDCSDKTDADWVGPDKTASSWFSELHNMAAVASTGDGSGVINLTAPLLDFSKWIAAVTGWTFAPTPARYFQYRALMESDDVNNLCLDGSSAATPCMPDITSVTPTAELSPAPYITSATGTSFYTSISSLSFTISGTCASDASHPVKYQLSKDGGSTYQYYNGTAWAAATAGTYSTASTQTQITAGLSTFTCASAPCTLMVRSYPGASAANSCNISAPVVSINRF